MPHLRSRLIASVSPVDGDVPSGAHRVQRDAIAGVELHGWWQRTDQDATATDQQVNRCTIDGPLAERPPGLLIMDVDSTLITTEQIELLAVHAGAGEQVAQITERAMQGELDFAASLAERVATLRGLPVRVIDQVRTSIQLSPGAESLIRTIVDHGGAVALVSGGFTEIVAPIAEDLAIELVRANRLEVVDGQLTGRTIGPVIDRAAKAEWLRTFAAELGVPMELTVAIGDGANDLDMLAAAGLGIAYCAKPVVAAAADAAISFPRLDAALVFLGLTD